MLVCYFLGLALVVVTIRRAVSLEPVQQVMDASGCQGDAGIGPAVIKVDRVPVIADRVAAGKHHVAYVSFALVDFFRTEDPGLTA